MGSSRITPIIFLLYALAAFYMTVREGMLLSGGQDYEYFVKPLLMPLLGWYFINRTGFSIKDDRKFVLAALFFCWLGDSFLMYTEKSEIYFMLGLGSFLMGHVFYIICYRKFADGPLKGRPDTLLSLLLLAYFVWVFIKILPGVDSLLIPVVLYSIVILSMAFSANMRRNQTTSVSYWLVMTGALLFVISDSVIALGKFSQAIPLVSSMLIMSTYTVGQFLIVQGLVVHWTERGE
jgi:uncharacterized membrane protein YhhN